MPGTKPRFVLFDLDGTLVDSSEDLAAAVNAGLAPLGVAPFTAGAIRELVGEGVTRLIQKVTPAAHVARHEDIKARMLAHYQANATRRTRDYPGIRDLLEALHSDRVPCAVVSNKNEALSRQVLAELDLAPFFAFIMGSDSASEHKPSPFPLRLAAGRLGREPSKGLMVGDSEFDMLAGRRAGMTTCAVTWGFRTRESLEALAPDRIVTDPAELAAWLCPVSD